MKKKPKINPEVAKLIAELSKPGVFVRLPTEFSLDAWGVNMTIRVTVPGKGSRRG